jgi:hypothetical protein
MAGLSSVSPPQERTLPPLRKNLQFLRGAPTPEGVPTWTIVDPVRNKYFQIEWQVYQLLQRWSCGTVEKLVAVVRRDTTSRIRAEDVEDLVRFLYANSLTEQSASGRVKDYVEQEVARHQAWWQWLLHHYLFIKIPLMRPHRFLHATLPLVAPLYTPHGGMVLWNDRRDRACSWWDSSGTRFLSTFLHFFTWQRGLDVRRGAVRRQGRARIGACVYGDAIRMPGAHDRCGLDGDDAGALFGHQRRLSAEFEAETSVDRRGRGRGRTWARCGCDLVVGISAGWGHPERRLRGGDDQLGDEPGGQPQPLHEV